ncbi:39623_t:CDS:2, partial [Gigaspora margarita]
PLLKLIKNKAELQVTTSISLLKHKGLGNCRALADELFQKQKFNLAYLVLLKAEELKFHFNFLSELWQIEQDRTPLNEVLEKVFNRKTADALKRLNLFTTAQLTSANGSELITWSQLKLCRKQSKRGRKPRWFIALENCLIDDRRNRKLVSEYVIPDYNSLALSIELPAVSLDKRKKELVLVENKDDNRKIFKIVQKSKAKILGKHYCNILLADPNQFEIKKCKGYSGNTARMTGKVDEE